MKRIAVDMDGVLSDTYAQYITWYERDFGIRKTREDVIGKPELEAFPKVREYLYTDGFFRTAPVIADSQKVLARLQEQYEIFIVSSATEFPQSLTEKQAWLGEHFPFISWKQMVFCGSKTIIHADIMIDDHLKNLDHFSGETFMFSQPHNLLWRGPKHKRVNSWLEIENTLL